MSHLFKKTLQLLIGTEDPMMEDIPTGYLKEEPVTPQEKRAEKYARHDQKNKLTERELIQRESEIGAELFGEAPAGHRREFFNLDPSTWIWYDETIGRHGKPKDTVTVRYEIHNNGILKVQEGARYTFIEGAELENFVVATQMYYERVSREVYHRQPNALLAS